jgi:Protein of unknown function (DUF1822)
MESSILFTSSDPSEVWLKLNQENYSPILENCHTFSSTASQWNAYLNTLCMNAVLDWLKEDYDSRATTRLPLAALSSFWEVINGTPLAVGDKCWLVLPSETIETEEFRIPQEWVDIPNLVADFYLAAQVDLEQQWIRIWGYTTHQHLMSGGRYDPHDRSYCLKREQVITDLGCLWTDHQLLLEEPTRAPVEQLPFLSSMQAEQLLERLGQQQITFVRLAVPFTLWGALFAHDGWRQRLADKRQGREEQWSIRQWLRTGIATVAQEIGWQLSMVEPESAQAREASSQQNEAILIRSFMIDDQPFELRIIPRGSGVWRFALHPKLWNQRIPEGLKLRLLTEDLQTFPNNEDEAEFATEQLYIDVEIGIDSREGLVWEIEPQPQQYIQEILYF